MYNNQIIPTNHITNDILWQIMNSPFYYKVYATYRTYVQTQYYVKNFIYLKFHFGESSSFIFVWLDRRPVRYWKTINQYRKNVNKDRYMYIEKQI